MIFLMIFSTVLLILYSYVGWKILWPIEIPYHYKILLIVLLAIFYCLPIITFAFYFNKIENNFTRIIAWLGYTGLGTVSLLFFIQICVDIVLAMKSIFTRGNHFNPHRRAFLGLSLKGIVGGMGAIGTVWGLYNAVKTPVIKKVKISITDLPKSLQGLRMAQISDLHVGSMIGKNFISKVVKKIDKINPDILFFTGDAADGSVESYGSHLEALGKIQPRYGKFFVTGNHEYYSDMNGWLHLIENLGFKILINESQNIIINGSIVMVTGIPDRGGKYFSDFHKTDMEKAVGGMPKPDFKILLAHQPKDVEHAVKYNFHLQLSGHTHGGQYFPFSLLVQMAHPFLKGLHKRNNTWVYINQGTGYWGPPLRIGTEPEITELTLTA